jgi:hypothetical protein
MASRAILLRNRAILSREEHSAAPGHAPKEAFPPEPRREARAGMSSVCGSNASLRFTMVPSHTFRPPNWRFREKLFLQEIRAVGVAWCLGLLSAMA